MELKWDKMHKKLAISKFDRNKMSNQFVDFLVTNVNK